jgi:transketolase
VRTALLETLTELAASDDRVFLLTGDLGWSVVEGFAAEYPDRFVNVGVAEQNLAGVAAGLAMTGYVPFIYSIATFTSMRCYEQVRNGAVLHHLPVRVIGIGGGFSYGHAGPTHHALEDLSIARTQPGLTTLAPADPAQTKAVIRWSMSHPGPCYLRIGKGGNPPVPGLDGRFAPGRPEVVREGRDVLLLAVGGVVHDCLAAAELLSARGLSATVAVTAHLPFEPSPELIALLRRFPAAVTAEEGSAVGGLGSLAAEAIATAGLRTRLHIAGVRRPADGRSGSDKWMRSLHGLDPASLADAAVRMVEAGRHG